MKHPLNLLALLLCLSVAAVAAQNAPMRIQPLPQPQAQAAIQPIEMTPREELSADPRVVDPEGYMNRLEQQNRDLRAENDALKRDKTSVDAQLQAMTTRGGSEVRAYCENPETSRNTAGASQSCGAYSCSEVSGLCSDRCTSSDQCSGNNRCDVKYGVCSERPIDG